MSDIHELNKTKFVMEPLAAGLQPAFYGQTQWKL